ncbi:hypothetical protein FACS189472_06360 [Alphaproteobacteria bacterium]|nr:hypothetical protein FACS189472_06360 [Alphaproteobacteria bacterium]
MLVQLFDETNKFIPLKVNTDYEISVDYPHEIRRVRDKFCPSNSIANGYKQINLDDMLPPLPIHYIIARQWVHCSDVINDTQIDHFNRDKLDNRVSNLRWVTRSQNQRNRHTNKGEPVQFLDAIPRTSRPLKHYGRHKLEPGYWINVFYNASGRLICNVYFRNEFQFYKLMKRKHMKKYPCYNVKIKDRNREIPAIIERLAQMQ